MGCARDIGQARAFLQIVFWGGGSFVGSVVVAHDYLTQRGGAERVALELASRLDAARVVTSVYRGSRTFAGFADFEVVESPSRLVRALGEDPRRALPFLAPAWSEMAPIEADVVVCSSSGWAHGAPVASGTRKIVYCHNPARWLYQADDYLQGRGPASRAAIRVLGPRLRRWDQRAAASADVYVANSTSVARRIREVYGREAEVVHPPVSLDVEAPQRAVDGLDPGFFLTIARTRGYKGTKVLCDAFARLPEERLVIVGMPADAALPPNVRALGVVDDEVIRWLYANARALVSVSREDFGLTPIEANAFGTPSLVLRAGGFLDTTLAGQSGEFIDDGSVDSVLGAVRRFPHDWDRAAVAATAERFSAKSFGDRMREIVASTSTRSRAQAVIA
jgi:glycosyltransferase involved in cell wall biosynthesis